MRDALRFVALAAMFVGGCMVPASNESMSSSGGRSRSSSEESQIAAGKTKNGSPGSAEYPGEEREDEVPAPTFGVLGADPKHLAEEQAAGIEWAMIELAWEHLEPQQGQFDEPSLARPREVLRTFKKAGWKIELSLGIHHPPAWAIGIEPWKDQDGKTYTESAPNWFNAQVQTAIASYIRKVMSLLGPENVDAVRIGSPANAAEVQYPHIPAFKYPAYSASALAGTPLIPPNPAPQCRPPSCSAADAKTFWSWYATSLARIGDFQVRTLREAGFRGDAQWLLAGGGLRADLLEDLFANHLTVPSFDDPIGIVSAGIDYALIIPAIEEKGPKTVISCTGLNDASTLDPDEASKDTGRWSAPHWVAHLARKNGITRLSSENVGWSQERGYDKKVHMELALRKMKELGYWKLMWAFEDRLHKPDGTSMAEYAAGIAAYR